MEELFTSQEKKFLREIEYDDEKEVIEKLVRQKLTEGSEVTANSMRPLAAAARTGNTTPVASKVSSAA